MKRTLTAVAAALLLAAGGAALYAESSSTLTVVSSEMKEGETKSFTDDGRTVTVRRQGNSTHVTVEGADKTEKLTITREGGRIRIHRGDEGGTRSLIVGPERRKIIIDGVPFGDFEGLPLLRDRQPGKLQSFYICPKDKTLLRVPEGKDKDEATYKCPVDGTVMEKKKGRGFTFFFDDTVFETHEL